MKTKALQQLFLLFVSFLVASNTVTAQQHDVFAAVPESQRARLVERLALLIQYEREDRSDKLYDLLLSDITNGKSKTEFVRERENFDAGLPEFRTLDFTPQSFQPNGGHYGQGIIYGCGTYREKGKMKRYKLNQ